MIAPGDVCEVARVEVGDSVHEADAFLHEEFFLGFGEVAFHGDDDGFF